MSDNYYCSHGTLKSSYCHECTAPEPTNKEIREYLSRKDLLEPKLQGYCKVLLDRLEALESQLELKTTRVGELARKWKEAEVQLKSILDMP
jgi:hypothetical protein